MDVFVNKNCRSRKWIVAHLMAAVLMIPFLLWGGTSHFAISGAIAQVPKNDEKVETKRERIILRFLTSNDYPPFNYYDEEGNLSGFHIDLATAICIQMRVQCDIKVTNWNLLSDTFNSGDFDAIIAGMAIDKTNTSKLDFTSPYMRFPGRFATLKKRPQPLPSLTNLYGKTVGVVALTSHAAYLKTFFKDVKITHFTTLKDATNALQEGKIDYLFGDSIQLMFWLNGSLSKQCCKFRGSSYWDASYFGEGLAIAIAKGDMTLRIELNEAMHNLRKTGQFPDLMLRYFPMKIY